MTAMSTMRYSAGDVIIESKPFIHAINYDMKAKYCDYCIKSNTALKKCTKCQFMYYCDKNCQTNDWIEAHKYECNIFAKHIQSIIETLKIVDKNLMLLRLIIVFIKNKNVLSKMYSLHDGSDRCFNDLMSNEIHINSDRIKNAVLRKLSNSLKQFELELSFDELCVLYGQIQTNSFGLYVSNETFTELTGIGCALYIPISVFNHSCEPNAEWVDNGITMSVRAMKRIEPNQEICISYIDVQKPKIERHLKLKERYYFDCHCVKCDSNFDDNFDYNEFRRLLMIYDMSRNTNLSVVILAEKILNLRKVMFGNYNPMYSTYMLHHSDLLIGSMQRNYNGYSRQQIEPFLRQTELNLRVTHGKHHRIYAYYMELLKNCEIRLKFANQ